MNLTLTGHHLEITPAIRDYITAKLERIKRHFDDMMDITIIIRAEKLEKKIEANVRVKGKAIFAEYNDPDLYTAIDILADRLDRQIIKHKELHYKDRHNGTLKHQESE